MWNRSSSCKRCIPQTSNFAVDRTMIKIACWSQKKRLRRPTPTDKELIGLKRGIVSAGRGPGGDWLWHGIQLAVEQIPESAWGKKPRVRVALHERVDLELCVVEDVRRRRRQVCVDRLANSRVQTHLPTNTQCTPQVPTLYLHTSGVLG